MTDDTTDSLEMVRELAEEAKVLRQEIDERADRLRDVEHEVDGELQRLHDAGHLDVTQTVKLRAHLADDNFKKVVSRLAEFLDDE